MEESAPKEIVLWGPDALYIKVVVDAIACRGTINVLKIYTIGIQINLVEKEGPFVTPNHTKYNEFIFSLTRPTTTFYLFFGVLVFLNKVVSFPSSREMIDN